MKKCTLAILGLALALTASSAVRAQVMLDLSKVTCGQFLKYRIANPKYIAMWLSGYFHGKRGSTIVDTQRLISNVNEVEKYCFKNPEALLMPTVETVIGVN